MPEVIATGLLVSRFTAQAPSGNTGPTGAPDGLFVAVAGLAEIRCTNPPVSDARIQATEVKQMAEIAASELHHVLLDGWYPALDQGWRNGWRALVETFDPAGNLIDSTPYDIMGVESDSQTRMTRVEIRLVTV